MMSYDEGSGLVTLCRYLTLSEDVALIMMIYIGLQMHKQGISDKNLHKKLEYFYSPYRKDFNVQSATSTSRVSGKIGSKYLTNS